MNDVHFRFKGCILRIWLMAFWLIFCFLVILEHLLHKWNIPLTQEKYIMIVFFLSFSSGQWATWGGEVDHDQLTWTVPTYSSDFHFEKASIHSHRLIDYVIILVCCNLIRTKTQTQHGKVHSIVNSNNYHTYYCDNPYFTWIDSHRVTHCQLFRKWLQFAPSWPVPVLQYAV